MNALIALNCNENVTNGSSIYRHFQVDPTVEIDLDQRLRSIYT